LIDLSFVYLVLVTISGGLLKTLYGWVNAKKPDGTRETWDWRMFTGSMLNILMAAGGWVLINYAVGEVTLASYAGAFAFGIATDNIVHEAQK
jgi:multisubunit Na+/H+ antiporter MnhB subunit